MAILPRIASFAALALGGLLAAQDPAAAPAAEPAVPEVPTFTQHVAPIVFQRCTQCHRPGEVAPFPLTSFREVQKKGRMVAKVTADRYMPPWHPEPGHGEFTNNPRLTDREIATIAAWVKTGMTEGPAEALPELPKFPVGWQLGEPDLVLQMPQAFEVPASGPDIYRNFAIPMGLEEDAWITAIEVRASAPSVLHHILFFTDDTGESAKIVEKDGKPGFKGMRMRQIEPLAGWAVGGMPEKLPDGLGLRVKKGTDLVLQSHFHPSGKKEREQTILGIHFAKQPPSRTLVTIQLPPFFGRTSGLDIPANEKNYLLKDSFELPCDVEGITVGGHAHMLCTSMRMTAELPDGKKEPLLWIRKWDFDWQNRYTYAAPVKLPKGTTIRAEITYDNSKDNKANPNNPPKRVKWGFESEDEMGSISLMVVPSDESDLQALVAAVRTKQLTSAVDPSRMEEVMSQAEQRIKQFDKNGDNKVSKDELPPRMQGMFDFLDRNGDGVLDKTDMEGMTGGAGAGGAGSGGAGGGGRNPTKPGGNRGSGR